MLNKQIKRRDFLKIAGIGIASAAIPSFAYGRSKAGLADSQPNILILMTDQQRYDSVGCYGSKAAHTPNFDRLADEGVLFEHCYVSNPICSPSRSSMLTGKTVPGHGLYRLYDNLPDDQVMFTKRLQQAGYTTALFGKLHVSGRLKETRERHPNDGFDIYEWCLEPSIHMDSPFNGYIKWLKKKSPAYYERLKREGRNLKRIPKHLHFTHWAAERTIDLIEHSKPGKPFFGLMSVFDPHNPYRGYPPEMAKLIDEDKIEDLVTGPETGPQVSAIEHERRRSYLGEFSEFSKEEFRTMRRDYHATIAFFDEEVGRVLDALEKKGIADNTLVIVTSDGGDMLGDHRLLVKGAFFYDPSIRVPLVMRWPGKLPAGKKNDELVQLQDLAATILSSAGVLTEEVQSTMPESMDLVGLCNGRITKVRNYAISTYRNTGIWNNGMYPDPQIIGTMLRTKTHKLVVYLNGPDAEEPLEGQLFDMQRDKNELHNLWDSPAHQAIKLQLMSYLVEWETRQELLLGSRGGGQVPGPSERLDNRLKK
ncbi:MAG: sulfatase family protein [Planctomycetota bacterium]